MFRLAEKIEFIFFLSPWIAVYCKVSHPLCGVIEKSDLNVDQVVLCLFGLVLSYLGHLEELGLIRSECILDGILEAILIRGGF